MDKNGAVEVNFWNALRSQNKVLPKDFAKRIAPIVDLRNRLVHRYEKIDKNLFLKMLYKEKDKIHWEVFREINLEEFNLGLFKKLIFVII